MQIDMHFYGVYALARAAGVYDDIARKIAYASQFVDDAIDDKHIILGDDRAIVPTMTSHKPIDYQNAQTDDQWKIWIPFHFLPGCKGRKFIDRLVCEKNSPPAKKMLEYTLDQKNTQFWPHLIGIAAHAYADTFSHYGFIGISHENNKVVEKTIKILPKHSSGIRSYLKAKFEEFKTRFISGFAEVIPVGHGSVGTYPDRPYLSWEYIHEIRKQGSARMKVTRDNLKDYLESTRYIYNYLKQFAELDSEFGDVEGGESWAKIRPVVQSILKTEGPKDKRIEKWKNQLKEGKFCAPTNMDVNIKYDEGIWRPRRAELELGSGGGSIEDSDACQFIQAARQYRNYVLSDLLPSIGLTLP